MFIHYLYPHKHHLESDSEDVDLGIEEEALENIENDAELAKEE